MSQTDQYRNEPQRESFCDVRMEVRRRFVWSELKNGLASAIEAIFENCTGNRPAGYYRHIARS